MKPRPRLTQDNNPLNRRPVPGGESLTPPPVTTPPATEWVSYQIPPQLRQKLHTLQQQWQTQMPELTESQLVELALKFFLEQSRRVPPPKATPQLSPAAEPEDLMGYLD
ncbi:hypothetical protein GlitD10_1734 [Gloeomargarita lithophora Alchichica-D10]|uniref:Uncharacterized protein n=1 Tax=Gloeomargarita lithophora Alchichica-D10 TaxID=1188229 RepID=A0A1J0ADP6_9CYAN|nr:hypothetical protein [Gloeomargarita lithophora]APB34060.1 hypothetical protein GlitD10_1734 [Gloeomargarita lithophora Alchichica-D10]